MLGAFLAQLYDDLPPPPLVLLSHEPPERALIAEALALKAGRQVEIHRPQRGDKRAAVEHAATNAREALERSMAEGTAQEALLQGVARLFDLPATPERIEVYDNSHIQGANAYGVMVVAGPAGFLKNAYRKFSIRATSGMPAPAPRGGDDFAMMREVFERRFGRALKEDPERESGTWPDLVLIDGGIGQLNAAREVLAEIGVPRHAAGRRRQGAGPRRRARMVPPAPAATPSSSRRAIRCSTTCNGCGTRRTASPSPPTAPAAPRRSRGASWTRSPASAAPSSAGC